MSPENGLSGGDLMKLLGKRITKATYGDVDGFDYEALALRFEDGTEFVLGPWDYEGYAAGLEREWRDA